MNPYIKNLEKIEFVVTMACTGKCRHCSEGNHDGFTEHILDVLKQHNVKAAFFLVGNFIQTSPELVKRMVNEGHTVGNHTMTHPHALQLSPNAFFRQILQTRIRIECAVDRTINSYVAPFGWQWNNADMAQMPLYAA